MREIGGDGAEIEALLAGEVGDAEAAAEVEELDRGGLSAARRPVRRSCCWASTMASGRRFCEPEQVEALEGEAGRPISASSSGHLFGVDAELLGAAAHLHAGPLSSKSG